MHHNDRHSVAKAPMVQLLTTIREVFHPFHSLGPSLQWGVRWFAIHWRNGIYMDLH